MMSVIILCVFAYTSQGVALYAAGISLALNGWHQLFSFIETLFWIPEKTAEVTNQIPFFRVNYEKTYIYVNITQQLLAQRYNITTK
jgi:hypothetical protein